MSVLECPYLLLSTLDTVWWTVPGLLLVSPTVVVMAAVTLSTLVLDVPLFWLMTFVSYVFTLVAIFDSVLQLVCGVLQRGVPNLIGRDSFPRPKVCTKLQV